MDNDTESTNMPPEIAALLEAKRAILIVNGVVQCRCEKDQAQSWRLRFREHDGESGYRVHRSVALGGEAVAKAVMATLDKWRTNHQEQSAEAAVNEKRKCAENLDPAIADEIRKTRPAIVVSRDAMGVLGLRVIVPITAWQARFIGHDWLVQLHPDGANGLDKTSTADTLQVRSVAVQRFVRRLGQLHNTDMNRVAKALKIVLDV